MHFPSTGLKQSGYKLSAFPQKRRFLLVQKLGRVVSLAYCYPYNVGLLKAK